METLRNPVSNFPVIGLAAIIATGMLLLFNHSLSKINIQPQIFVRPEPVHIPYNKPSDPVKIEETEIFTGETVALVKEDTSTPSANPPVTAAPVIPGRFDRPGDIVIPGVKPGIDYRPAHTPEWFTPDQVEHRPRVLKPVTPIYPYQATVKGIEGRVVLRFIVDENGEVLNPVVVKAEPEGVFEEAALAAIAKYKFIPASIGKKKVKCVAAIPMGFRIN